MKLLAKTSLYYLILSIPILILSGFIGYHFITIEVKDSNNELLLNRKTLVENYLKSKDTLLLNLITKSNEAQIDKVYRKNATENTFFSDTLILDKKENELAINRMVTSIVNIDSMQYQIKIWRSTLEYDELVNAILYLLGSILFFLFLVSIVINFWISRTLWEPFYKTVSLLKTFSASDNQSPVFTKTSIKEFKELNSSLTSMMDKMIVDYNGQKKFSENASHETQTPLAVIKSKIDLLIQSDNIKENEIKLITAIDDACSKLIRLNKSLLLLTKIENKQFKTTENVSVEKMIENALDLFEEHIKFSKIIVSKDVDADFRLKINPDLCAVLINNLLQNAIRHNINGGTIGITIKQDCLIILNSGKEEALNPVALFERFHKQSSSHQSIGLGLAIAKEIADASGLELKYNYISSKHCFVLSKK